MIIVFLQYSSNYNIGQLIQGNENLLEALQIKTSLQKLQTEVVALESKVRGAIIGGKNIDTDHLKSELNTIDLTISDLDSLDTDSLTFNLVSELKQNIKNRILFNTALLDTLRSEGKDAAEKMANSHPSSLLADTLNKLASTIDSIHELSVTTLIKVADKNTSKAKTFSTILAILATIAIIFTFGYISYKVKEQQLLIIKLNESEKKILDVVRIKENFLANMSHEIRTPLNSILGFTQLLDKQDLPPDTKEYINYIKSSGDGLYRVVNDILDTSKIEAGMVRIEHVPFDLSENIKQLEALFCKKIADKGLVWSIKIDPSVPYDLEGDATRLNQILINLLSNALKFTEKGIVSIHITLSERENNKVWLCFEVADSGIGISKENLSIIFKRFHQADDTITRKYGGSGLGLTIVKELVDLQGGKIVVESEVDKGTTFKVILPFGLQTGGNMKNLVHEAMQDTENNKYEAAILLVEDNIMNQNLMRQILSAFVTRYDLVSNGAEAIEKLKVKAYDIILMDIQMPVIDGYTATSLIRNQLQLTIPIIGMTAYAMEREKAKCLSMGMNDYLSKPIKIEALHGIIEKYLPHATHSGMYHTLVTHQDKSLVDFQYLDDLFPGNNYFKQNILNQFIINAPQEIYQLETSIKGNQQEHIKSIAHHIKSTISIMGAESEALKILDAIEHSSLNQLDIKTNVSRLKTIIVEAVRQAQILVQSLDQTI
jgi:signal transduction histidine kinase/DNA-binding LytR/AlgR family response regulator